MATSIQDYINKVKLPKQAANSGLATTLAGSKVSTPLVPVPKASSPFTGVKSAPAKPMNNSDNVLRTASPAAVKPTNIPKATVTNIPSQSSGTSLSSRDSYLNTISKNNPELADKVMDVLGYSGSPNQKGSAYNDYLSQYSNAVQTSTAKTERADKKKSDEQSSYLKYLQTMFDPKKAQVAQENVNRLNQQISSETLRARSEEDRIRKNEMGGLETGQNSDLGVLNRESSKTLADLAIAKGYSTDILKQYTDAGKSLYEAEQAATQEANELLSVSEATALGVPYGITKGDARKYGIIPTSNEDTGFSLSEGQARYDSKGNLIAQRGKTYAPGTTGVNSDGSVNYSKLPTGIKEDMITMDTVKDLANQFLLTKTSQGFTGTGGFGAGTIGQIGAAIGFGKPENIQQRNLIGNIKATIAKLRGGTSFTAGEEKLLNQYTPTINDNDIVAEQKLKDLISFIDTKKNNTLAISGISSGQSSYSSPQQLQLPNGDIVTLQADGTYE